LSYRRKGERREENKIKINIYIKAIGIMNHLNAH